MHRGTWQNAGNSNYWIYPKTKEIKMDGRVAPAFRFARRFECDAQAVLDALIKSEIPQMVISQLSDEGILAILLNQGSFREYVLQDENIYMDNQRGRAKKQYNIKYRDNDGAEHTFEKTYVQKKRANDVRDKLIEKGYEAWIE